MSNETFTNPYESIEILHNQGLDFTISNLNSSPTIDDLLNCIAE